MPDDKVYKNPAPTVDILIELDGRPGTLVFIERAHQPRGWALPGGRLRYPHLLVSLR